MSVNKNYMRIFYMAVLLFFPAAIVTPAFSQIDWTNGVVRAKGSGVPPANMPAAQGKLMAKRAAVADAYRNMAEMVQGVQVNSETTVKNFVTESDVINTKVQAFIKGAQIVDETQAEDGTYEVTMETPIYGVGSLADILLNEVTKKSDKYAYETSDEKSSEEYTGLVIDARGVNVKPSLAPDVFNTNAEIVYDISMMEPSVYVEKGVVTFVEGGEGILNEGMAPAKPLMFALTPFMRFDIAGFFMPHMAVINPKVKNKVGEKPLVIKAVDPSTTSGNVSALAPYNVVVSADDGNKILNANKKKPILNNGNVVVITGTSGTGNVSPVLTTPQPVNSLITDSFFLTPQKAKLNEVASGIEANISFLQNVSGRGWTVKIPWAAGNSFEETLNPSDGTLQQVLKDGAGKIVYIGIFDRKGKVKITDSGSKIACPWSCEITRAEGISQQEIMLKVFLDSTTMTVVRKPGSEWTCTGGALKCL